MRLAELTRLDVEGVAPADPIVQVVAVSDPEARQPFPLRTNPVTGVIGCLGVPDFVYVRHMLVDRDRVRAGTVAKPLLRDVVRVVVLIFGECFERPVVDLDDTASIVVLILGEDRCAWRTQSGAGEDLVG